MAEDPNKGQFVTEGEDAQEAGYWGTRDNPFPDEEFALTTGPDAPVQDMQGNPVDVEAAEAEDKAVAEKAESRAKEDEKASKATKDKG